MFVQNWNTVINNSTRARCYTLYADFWFQSYLNLMNIEKVRVALSRFRVSAHRLEVETGKWRKPVALYFLYMFTIMHGSLIHTMYESTFI